MRRIKLFSLIQERVARRMFPSRWSARRRASWSASGGSAAVESLETRCLLSAGDLDPSFGVGGRVTTGFEARCVAVQSDGKIVVAGTADAPGRNDFALARYNDDGSLDTSFDGDGEVTTSFGVQVQANAFSMALQADGKIVVAGYVSDHGSIDVALVRYNRDGSLDTSFDGDGKLTADFGTPADYANSVAVQADGKIVVAGFTGSGNVVDFALARFNTDGTLDTSFDADGKVITDLGTPSDFAHSVVVQTDGKIVVAGTAFDGSSNDGIAMARYNSDGSLDTSFDGDGKLTTDFGIPGVGLPGEVVAKSIALQADAKIVVAGYTNSFDDIDFALARYNSDGSLDTSFDGDGKLTTDFGTSSSLAFSMAVQADGKIVVAGYAGNDNNDFALARYNSDGSLDTSFDGDGKLTTHFGTPETPHDVAYGMALQSDGKIVVAGNSVLARYHNIDQPVVVTLPASGGSVTALIVGGMLHVRRSRTSPDLVAPVTLGHDTAIQIAGSNRNDRLTLDRSMNGFTGTITFNGNDGNDSLDARAVALNLTFNGGDDNDTFLGGSGNDSVDGGSGDDSLTGGNGNDSIRGGADNDRITGDAGNDVLFGGTGNDSLRGGTSDDTLLGDAGNDTLIGDRGNDVIDGGDDRDNLQGSDGNDSIRGGNGNDTIQGGNGNDLLIGSAGNDSLKGDAGADTLLGGSGNDTLNGGSGIDTINAGTGTDRITDSSRVIDTSFAFDFDALLAGLL